MNLTEEQKKVIECKEDLIVEARAGTGKTTTLIEYSKVNSKEKKLYFAFNKSISEEAKDKFDKAGVKNISISTAHGLAYKSVVAVQGYKLGYNSTTYGISKFYSLNRDATKYVHSAIQKFESFCNSADSNIDEFDFLSVLTTDRGKMFYQNNKKQIDKLAKDIWEDMERKKMDCSHSFYLKKYQLSKPKLSYDIIMLDEGQDANPVILDIFLSQKARKVIVGDNHQAIYGWRGAVNALRQVPYKKLYLTESFRFPQYIADLGLEVLSHKEGKEEGFDFSELKLIGRGTDQRIKTKAIISRSNLAILDNMIQNKFKYKKPYIEGGFESITKTSSGFDILELLALKLGNRSDIKNYTLHSFQSIKQLAEYYEDLDDTSITSAIIFIEKYGERLKQEVQDIKDKLVPNQQDADYIFSTIHKSKGREWDEVTILSPSSFDEGFPYKIPEVMTDKKTRKQNILTEDDKKKMLAKWIEELNIYYVAVTRAKVKLIHDIIWLDQEISNGNTNSIEEDDDEDYYEDVDLEGELIHLPTLNSSSGYETFFAKLNEKQCRLTLVNGKDDSHFIDFNIEDFKNLLNN